MKIIHEFEITKLVSGTNEYDAGDITVNWDRRSLWLNDNVEFRIILIGTTPDGEETRRYVANHF